MMQDVCENVVEDHLRTQVKRQLGGIAIKLYRRGWPDRLVILQGWIGFIETKRPVGGQYEPLQLRIHARLRRMGHTVLVLLTKAEVDSFIVSHRKHILVKEKKA